MNTSGGISLSLTETEQNFNKIKDVFSMLRRVPGRRAGGTMTALNRSNAGTRTKSCQICRINRWNLREKIVLWPAAADKPPRLADPQRGDNRPRALT
jgi:hypothetical protein